jgi:phosphoribosylanthranilate isomerase
MSPRKLIVKICGVTSPEDAELAVGAGADAIGVNLWPGSKRYVADARAAEILAVLPAGIIKVGVFVNASPAQVAERKALLGLDKVQLHGNEQPRSFESIDGSGIIRAVRVQAEGTFSSEAAWKPGLWLYDSYAVGYGGTGVQAPWELITRLGQRPFLLAGGLTPDNVGAGIAATNPDGVDVASGVESAPGRKDAVRLRRFVEAARAAAAKL